MILNQKVAEFVNDKGIEKVKDFAGAIFGWVFVSASESTECFLNLFSTLYLRGGPNVLAPGQATEEQPVELFCNLLVRFW